jgi:SAM-dependent methyltransferase
VTRPESCTLAPPTRPSAPAGGAGWLPWPLPALLAWAAGWAVWRMALGLQLPPALALGLALACSLALGWTCRGSWRRGLAMAGFPLSWLVLVAWPAWPAWVWVACILPLLLMYPPRAWRDAPFFPTPGRALEGLAAVLGAPGPAVVLDAGCGAGHGLQALAAQWPAARLHGVEWSRPLARLARWRCRQADVRRADMWAQDWGGFDLVYLFQRPESMPRAAAKATAQMRPGSWLVSLEFAVPGWTPQACLQHPGERPVWVYRLGMPGSGARTPGRSARRSTASPARR